MTPRDFHDVPPPPADGDPYTWQPADPLAAARGIAHGLVLTALVVLLVVAVHEGGRCGSPWYVEAVMR